MIKKVVIVLLLSLCMFSCFLDIPIPYVASISIPFRYQLEPTWCGVTCVQMWALKDGHDYSQHFIASQICGSNGRTSMERIAWGVGLFTDSSGYCGAFFSTETGQNSALSEAAGSLIGNQPAILPFSGGTHAIIARRFRYTETPFSHKVQVLNMSFNDPGLIDGENCFLTAGSLKSVYFKPVAEPDSPYGEFYKVVISDNSYSIFSENGYKEFLHRNGTYYGGPESYFPDGSQFIRVSVPIGSEVICIGEQINIEWESNGLSGNIKLELLKGDNYWGTIAMNLPIQQQSYAWTVGSYQGGTANAGDNYKIKITMMDGSDYDTSNVDFSIVDPPSVTVISPNGGENWTAGTSHDITWGAIGAIEFVKIEYSLNNGASWSTVVEQTANNGVYSWIIPNTPSAACRVRVSRLADAAIQDVSNTSFAIVAAAETVSTPSRPAGGALGLKAKSYSFSTGGSVSSLGHPLQYLFDWGDGTNSGWLPTGTTNATHSWAATGTYQVRAMARCATHTAVVSPWSPLLGVIIHEGTVSGSYNSPAQYKVLPEVIWASATGGDTWVSEVQLTDITGGSQVSVYYNTLSGRRGPFLLWNNSGGALSSIKYSNLLQTIDGLDSGTFAYYGTVGAVEFITQDGSHLVHAAVRELNGNYAKTSSALSLHDANTATTGRAMIVANLSSNATYRATVGFFNPTADSITVEFTLLNNSGAQIGAQFSKTLAGHIFQTFGPFSEAGVPYPGSSYDSVILRVRPTSGSGKLMCFGATANNTSNDPASHLAVQGATGYDNGPGSLQILPEVIWASATGGGTWISEVQLTDVTGGSQVSVYYNTLSGRRGPFLLWNNSGGAALSSSKYANLLQTIDGLDSGTFAYYGTVGAVEFITQDGSHLVHAAVRELNGNYAKTFSGLNLVNAETADTSRVMLIQNYTNNSTYRSTCGFYNPTAATVTVEFTLLDGGGAQIGSQFSETLAGHAFQAFSPFSKAGVPYPGSSYDNVILRVRPTSGSGKVVCFGASTNSASSDPAAHLAMQAE